MLDLLDGAHKVREIKFYGCVVAQCKKWIQKSQATYTDLVEEDG